MKYKVSSIKYKRVVFLLVLLHTAYSILYTPQAWAQTRTITISPPAVELSLDPGSSYEGTIKVINSSTDQVEFTTHIADFVVRDEKGTPDFLALQGRTLQGYGRYSASSWISVNPSSFALNPRESEIISYQIKVPQNARPGGHYAAVIFSNNPIRIDTTGASIGTQIGSLISLRISGQINEKAVVTKFSAPSFQEYGPVKIQTQIINDGDLHIRPKGEINVKDILGRTISQSSLEEINIFPEALRNYENTLGIHLMVGLFKAELTASYGEKENKLVASAYFWVIPWRIAVVGVLVLVVLVLLVMVIRKDKNNVSGTGDSIQ
jgi:hypothetical protein